MNKAFRPLSPLRSGAFYLCALAGVALAPWICVHATPAKYPKRLVNGRMVDLAPLCSWWTNHTGNRPLSGWVHLTGTVTSTNSLGWMVDARVPSKPQGSAEAGPGSAGSGKHQLLLLHPPLQDLAAFEQLSARLKSLEEKRAPLATEDQKLKETQKTVSQEQKGAHHNRARSSALAQENKSLTALDKNTKAQLDDLDKQIQVVKKELAGYPSSEHYVLDCFALDTGREQNGVPIYEHGTAYQQ